MTSAISDVPAAVIAASLQDVTGELVDPTSDDGHRRSVELLQKVLEDSESADQLVKAMRRHMDSAVSMTSAAWPLHYGRVVDAGRASSLVDDLDEPPMGSPEFSAYVRSSEKPPRLAFLADLDAARWMSLADPRTLGFGEALLEPPSKRATLELDRVLSRIERSLRNSASRRVPGVWHRVWSAIRHARTPSLSVMTRVLAANFVVIEAASGPVKVQTSSITSGSNIYIWVVTSGKTTLKDRFSADDQARAEEHIAAAFGSEMQAGAETLSQLRLAFLAGTATRFARHPTVPR